MVRLCLYAGAILFPCLILRTDSFSYSSDWLNHLWMVAYNADHIRLHGVPPVAFNTDEVGGVAYPVFYGFALYPLVGALAAAVGVRVAAWLSVLAVAALQFILVRRAVRCGGVDGGLGTVVACLVIWGIYPLTNLYNRGAAAEFFATGLLTCAVCRWFALLDADGPRARLRAALETGLCYALAAGCHPITALYGLAFLALFGVTLIFRADRALVRARVLALVPVALPVALALGPWVYACLTLADRVDIQPGPVVVFGDSIDRWWVRLFPLPVDARMFVPSATPVSTPHLEAQINVPLLILTGAVVGNVLRVRRSGAGGAWLALPLAVGALFLWLSLVAWPHAFLPVKFRYVQFAYRLVTYINLSMLVALLFACRVAARTGGPGGWTAYPPTVRTVLLTAAVTLSAAGVLLKFAQTRRLMLLPPLNSPHLPISFYGRKAYARFDDYQPLGAAEAGRVTETRLVVAPDARDRYAPATVELAQPGFAGTQIQPFPWNTFVVDGRPVPAGEVRTWGSPAARAEQLWPDGPYLAVPVPAGRHVLEHRVEPDRVWIILRWVSLSTLVVWPIGLLALRFPRPAPISA